MLGLIIAMLLTPPRPDSKPANGQDAARQLARSACVRVVNTKASSNGSGVVIAVRGAFLYVLTASHVVSEGKGFEVHLPPDKDGKVTILKEVDLLVNGPTQDVALLRVVAGDVRILPASLAQAAGSDEEFDAISAGYGDAAEPEVRAERVLAKKFLRRKSGKEWFAWECRDRPDVGRSGGPLLDKTGKLIGICNGTQDGKGYYCHADEIRALLKEQNHAWLWQPAGENGKK